jgi:hypothetical protein
LLPQKIGKYTVVVSWKALKDIWKKKLLEKCSITEVYIITRRIIFFLAPILVTFLPTVSDLKKS